LALTNPITAEKNSEYSEFLEKTLSISISSLFLLFTLTNQLVKVPDWNDSAIADIIADMYSNIKLLLSNKTRPTTLKIIPNNILFFAPILSVIAPHGSSVIKDANQKIDRYNPTSAKEKSFDSK